MFTHTSKSLEKDHVVQYTISANDKQLLYSEVLEKWQNDEAFRNYFIDLLKSSPFLAYFWETPPVKKNTVDRPFEFVLVKSPFLAKVKPEKHFFTQYFTSANAVSFPNLGRNAVLVVPCPISTLTNYPHLAAFVRGASNEQVHDFWKMVGQVMIEQLAEKPIWLSTAGTGVYWLHVRLDSRPKYYRFAKYKIS